MESQSRFQNQGVFRTLQVIKFLGPWKSVGQVEWETLKWVDWYNNTPGGIEKLFVDMPWRVISGFWRFD